MPAIPMIMFELGSIYIYIYIFYLYQCYIMFNYCTCESHKKCTYELLIRQKKASILKTLQQLHGRTFKGKTK